MFIYKSVVLLILFVYLLSCFFFWFGRLIVRSIDRLLFHSLDRFMVHICGYVSLYGCRCVYCAWLFSAFLFIWLNSLLLFCIHFVFFNFLRWIRSGKINKCLRKCTYLVWVHKYIRGQSCDSLFSVASAWISSVRTIQSKQAR